jgi:diguanylate cyclase
LGSSVPGALLSGQSLLYVVLLQAPLYFIAMTSAAFTLNRMLVATIDPLDEQYLATLAKPN